MNSCAVCGTNDVQEFARQKSFVWIRCNNCNYAFIDKIYDPEDEIDVLSNDRGAAYLEFYGEKFRKKMRRARRRAKLIKKIAPGNTVLDVGCNLGFMVEACRELGMNSTGIEVSSLVVDQAKKYFPESEFICGFLEEHKFNGKKFDAIYSSEVIEHVTNVNEFMEHISKRLNSGGIVYLTTPELRKYKDKSKENGWRDLHAPNHRQYFSKGNMTLFLEKHGFKSIKFLKNWNFKTGIKVIAVKE